VTGEDFLGRSYPADVPEAEPCQNRHDRCENKASYASDKCDRRELREGVGLEEESPKRRALEDGLDLSFQRCVRGLGLRKRFIPRSPTGRASLDYNSMGRLAHRFSSCPLERNIYPSTRLWRHDAIWGITDAVW
jgi:hypothetical protein